MKKLALVVLPAILLLAASCGQQVDIDTLLKNAETRNQIFTKITDDHEMMTEMMGKMMSNKHAKMMMQGNKDMMGMMKDNPDMMNEMMKDGKMMGHMMQMMNQEGMMSDEAMQSCMKMMSDKGMDMKGMMGDKNRMKKGN